MIALTFSGDLSTPLLHWSEQDPWTIGNAVEGLLCLGASGSGKSSTTGRKTLKAFLESGFGGLFLTAKKEGVDLAVEYCRQAGRLDDLILFSPQGPWVFNPLDFEMNRQGEGAGLIENLVNLFGIILDIAEQNSGPGSGREDESYWRKATRQLIRNFSQLQVLADGHVSIPDLYRAMVSAPMSLEQASSESWKSSSFCFKLLAAADAAQKSPTQQQDFALVADYILLELPALSDRTRSVIFSSFTSCIDVMNRGVLRHLFCGKTNFSPHDTEHGKIIVVALPVKEYGAVGVVANSLMKYCWQKAIEQRDTRRNPRPVFQFADEAQFFFHSHDFLFQSTCRSSRVATVYLTQNLSNIYDALGGDRAKSKADSLVGNLATKVFHANADPVTLEFGANLIGKRRQLFLNANSSHQAADWTSTIMGFGQQGQSGGGVSEQMDYEIQPSEFTRLRTGGHIHNGLVDVIVFQAGRLFHRTGRTWLPVTFNQSD